MAALLATVAISACPAGLLNAAVIDDFEVPVKFAEGGGGTNYFRWGLTNGQMVISRPYPIPTPTTNVMTTYDNVYWPAPRLPDGNLAGGRTLEVRMDLIHASADNLFLLLICGGPSDGKDSAYGVFVDRNEVGLMKYKDSVALNSFYWDTLATTNENVNVRLAFTKTNSALIITVKIVDKGNQRATLYERSFVDGPGQDGPVPPPDPHGYGFFIPDQGGPYTNFTYAAAGCSQMIFTIPPQLEMLLDNLEYDVLGQPIIITQPHSCNNVVGTTATFTVEALGTEPLAYQWQKKDYLGTVTDLADSTNATLVLTNVQASHEADYRVVVTNIQGSAISEFAHLYLIVRPVIGLQPTNWPPVSVGANVTNRVLASGTPTPSYQWCFKGKPLPGQTKNSIVLTNVQLSDAGDYTAVATNLAGSATSVVVTLTVDATFTKITTGPVVTESGGWLTPAWLDYDNDGLLDLFVAKIGSGGENRDAVYHNTGDGTFSPVTNAINLLLGSSVGGAVADYNNDGLPDLLVINWADSAADLYRNVGGGKFTQLTASQVGPIVTDRCCDAGWADYDLDGFLDLFVANSDTNFLNDCLYHNNGDRPFTRMTASQVGLLVADNALTAPCAWVDYDNDGWPDLWVGTGVEEWPRSGRQYLWHNNHGTFSRVLPGSLTNNLAKGLGLWADYDNDGYLDLFLTSEETNSLHHNLGGQTFTDVSTEAGVAKAMGAWDAAWGDYDNDGYLDLFVLSFDPPGPSVLYRNNGNGTFTSVEVGSPLRDGGLWRQGLAWADYDNDGFLDLLINCSNNEATTKNFLYRNNGNSNAWLKVKLVGLASNRSAIGAKVRVQATIRGQTVRQTREISGNSGLSGSSSGLLAHFGLGDATNVDQVRIEWPSGIVQQLTNVPVRQPLTVTEHQEATTPPSLAASKSADGKIQMSLTGQTNLLYVFEASTNLVQWRKIAVRTNLTGTVEFTPPTSSGPRQFYRVLMP
jgi:enediyne biosynthesis protein E4